MRMLATLCALNLWAAYAATAEAPSYVASTLEQLSHRLVANPSKLLWVELRLQATGQVRPISDAAAAHLRTKRTDPKAEPALRELHLREAQFFEAKNSVWMVLPEALFNHYQSDVAAGTTVRALAVATNTPDAQPLLLLQGYEVIGQAQFPASKPPSRISGSSNK